MFNRMCVGDVHRQGQVTRRSLPMSQGTRVGQPNNVLKAWLARCDLELSGMRPRQFAF